MLHNAKIVPLGEPLAAEAGDRLIIYEDGTVQVWRQENQVKMPNPPSFPQCPSSPDRANQCEFSPISPTMEEPERRPGCLAPERRASGAPRRALKTFTPQEHLAFEALVLEVLKNGVELDAPRIANSLGYRANSKDRSTDEHRTYDALVQTAVTLYKRGALKRRPIGGGPLRVIYAYSLKEAKA